MNMVKTAIATASFTLVASGALAIPLTLSPLAPSGSPSFVLDTPSNNEFGPLVENKVTQTPVSLADPLFDGQVVPGNPGTPVSSFGSGGPAGGLSVLGAGTATITYLGTEAFFTNITSSLGELSTATSSFGDSFSFTYDFGAGSGFLPLTFANTFNSTNPSVAATATNGGFIAPDLRISFTNVFNNGRSVIAFFEDTGGSSVDIDDMVVRVDVAPIPLPAGVWMFLTALGGLGVLSRKRKAAAAAA